MFRQLVHRAREREREADRQTDRRGEEEDTVWDFDDVADALPERGHLSLVAQGDLVTLHEPHVCREDGRRPLGALHAAPLAGR